MGNHAVDGLEDLGFIVDILQLHQGKARRVGGEILAGMGFFELLIAGLGRGQGVVAVAHGEDHGHAGKAFVLFPHVGGVVRQARFKVVHGLALHQPAGDVTAALHEVKVIELGKGLLPGGNGLEEHLIVVVAEHQDMGQLDGRVLAHPHPGRNALHHGLLRGADGGGGAGRIIIGIQIHHTNKTLADGAALQRALHIHKGTGIGLEHALFAVLGHGLVDEGGVGGLLGRAQLGLGQDKVDGGRRVAGGFAHPLPIGRLGGKLVAGDHGPFLHGVHPGHEDIGWQECLHGQVSFLWVPSIIGFSIHSFHAFTELANARDMTTPPTRLRRATSPYTGEAFSNSRFMSSTPSSTKTPCSPFFSV